MEKCGFEQVKEPQTGDVILISVGVNVPNHAAIYVGEQIVPHHAPKRLSKRDSYDGYWLKHTHSIWRYNAWSTLDFTAALNSLDLNLGNCKRQPKSFKLLLVKSPKLRQFIQQGLFTGRVGREYLDNRYLEARIKSTFKRRFDSPLHASFKRL